MPIDDELKAYLDASFAALRGEVTDARREFNDAQEKILNRLNGLEGDFQNIKGFLINDAAVSSKRWFELEQRVSDLERRLP